LDTSRRQTGHRDLLAVDLGLVAPDLRFQLKLLALPVQDPRHRSDQPSDEALRAFPCKPAGPGRHVSRGASDI